MTFDLPMLAGVVLPPAALFLAILAFRRLIVFTPEAHELLRLRFGRLATRSTAAGVSVSSQSRQD